MNDPQLVQFKYAVTMSLMSCLNQKLTPYLIQGITEEILIKIKDLLEPINKKEL